MYTPESKWTWVNLICLGSEGHTDELEDKWDKTVISYCVLVSTRHTLTLTRLSFTYDSYAHGHKREMAAFCLKLKPDKGFCLVQFIGLFTELFVFIGEIKAEGGRGPVTPIRPRAGCINHVYAFSHTLTSVCVGSMCVENVRTSHTPQNVHMHTHVCVDTKFQLSRTEQNGLLLSLLFPSGFIGNCVALSV